MKFICCSFDVVERVVVDLCVCLNMYAKLNCYSLCLLTCYYWKCYFLLKMFLAYASLLCDKFGPFSLNCKSVISIILLISYQLQNFQKLYSSFLRGDLQGNLYPYLENCYNNHMIICVIFVPVYAVSGQWMHWLHILEALPFLDKKITYTELCLIVFCQEKFHYTWVGASKESIKLKSVIDLRLFKQIKVLLKELNDIKSQKWTSKTKN